MHPAAVDTGNCAVKPTDVLSPQRAPVSVFLLSVQKDFRLLWSSVMIEGLWEKIRPSDADVALKSPSLFQIGRLFCSIPSEHCLFSTHHTVRML